MRTVWSFTKWKEANSQMIKKKRVTPNFLNSTKLGTFRSLINYNIRHTTSV